MDKVLLACLHSNLDACLELANEHGLGLEIQSFAFPSMLGDDLAAHLREYRARLQDFTGPLTMHGAFMDLTNASLDPKIVAVTHERYTQALEIAAELGARIVVFHANYIAQMRGEEFRRGWTARQVDFWGPMVELAAQYEVQIALENMWEFEPQIVGDVLRQIDSPMMFTCLDVSHAHLYGEVPLEVWLADLEGFIHYTHLNNTSDGLHDDHRGLDDGVIDYEATLRQLRALPEQPYFSLEIENVTAMRRSLPFFELVSAPEHSAAS